MLKAVKIATAVATSLSLMGGLAGVAGASAGTINTTGPYSTNKVSSSYEQKTTVANTNSLGASNSNSPRSI
jgi:hypothetical protein